MILRGIFLLYFITPSAFQVNTEAACTIRNNVFSNGERIVFHVYYTLAGVWVHAGVASFNVSLTRLNDRPVYHVVGDGRTLPGYDWIYRVRDRYETYIDTGTLLPLRFVRNVDEGGYRKYENVSFYHERNTAISNDGAFKIPDCVQDVLSEVYLARNMNFNGLKPGDKIPFNLFLDNENYSMYVKFMGRETIKTRYGKFRCIRFKPLLLKGTIFKGGEEMNVWVTDDENRLPVRVESPIVVGSVKVDMISYYNLRHPLTSLISVR